MLNRRGLEIRCIGYVCIKLTHKKEKEKERKEEVGKKCWDGMGWIRSFELGFGVSEWWIQFIKCMSGYAYRTYIICTE